MLQKSQNHPMRNSFREIQQMKKRIKVKGFCLKIGDLCQIKILDVGQYFGEKEILDNTVRTTQAKCLTPVCLFFINKRVFPFQIPYLLFEIRNSFL